LLHTTTKTFSKYVFLQRLDEVSGVHFDTQCSICVFDGLLPEPYNKQLSKLLFILAHWHALAKLRLHTDSSLELLESTTELLGKAFRIFEEQTCPAFETYELKRETEARQRQQAKKSSTGPANPAAARSNAARETPTALPASSSQPSISNPAAARGFNWPNTVSVVHTAAATSSSSSSFGSAAPCIPLPSSSLVTQYPAPPSPDPSTSAEVSKKGKGKAATGGAIGRRKKAFNRCTYKNHSLGDYVKTIRMYGTTDSYSTEGVGLSLSHHGAARIHGIEHPDRVRAQKPQISVHSNKSEAV
jgi:hypothetical protein